MARFLAQHTLKADEKQFLDMAKQLSPKVPKGYAWKQTYCDFAGNKFFCEWDAPSKDALAQAFKANNLPFDVIYPVKLFDVARKDFVK
jgi:hypothetical protein